LGDDAEVSIGRSARTGLRETKTTEKKEHNVAVELIHPAGVIKVDPHHQISVATGSRFISMAGQVSWDTEGEVVGEGDLAAQTEQCFMNVAAALAGAGATMEDVTGMTVYIVDLDTAKGELVMQGRARAAERLGVVLQQPGTYIGVSSLWAPSFLIEIDATALVD
jgi:enamine deaminase RidA (YjgF/YER057c/UK114 family)